MKLMIVDDSSMIRSKIERVAGLDGITGCCTASNGREAIEVFRREKPQLVTMDLTMPEMGGVECIKRLCEIDPAVRILVISALSDKSTALHAIKNGAKGFLCKPFNDDDLCAALTTLVKR